MPLSPEQRAKLEAEAKRRGIDPDALIAAAESEVGKSASSPQKSDAPAGAGDASEPGSLFMYLLPFVTVGEVRRIWLKVPGSLPGADDNENAAGWAAKMAAPPSEPPPAE